MSSLADHAGAATRAHKPKREKQFGEGRAVPLDRNAKIRIMTLARASMRRTEAGRHYGDVSAKALAVLGALLWGFHNAGSGRCFPSYERIAEKADCARSTVYEAIRALEAAGILTWVNRIARIREWGPDLFGRAKNRWRVIRTSNAYTFTDPQAKRAAEAARVSSKSELPTGTLNQDLERKIFNPWEQRIRAAQLKLDLAERRERWGSINDTLRERALGAFKERSRA